MPTGVQASEWRSTGVYLRAVQTYMVRLSRKTVKG